MAAPAGSNPHSAQTWNSDRYAANGRFVATLATAVVDLLNPQPGERILDAGCGDGALTEQLSASGAQMRGVDSSAAMVAAARARGLTIDQADLTQLPYDADFDAVFSNAALHWIPGPAQPAALAAIHRSLRPGGRFVAEMGGFANIAAIRVALAATLAPHGLDAEASPPAFTLRPSTTLPCSSLPGSRFARSSSSRAPRRCPTVPKACAPGSKPSATACSTSCPHPPPASKPSPPPVDLLRPILQEPKPNPGPPTTSASASTPCVAERP